jgi:hypothetical protein
VGIVPTAIQLYIVVHKKGSLNTAPDVLSRIDWTAVEGNKTEAEKVETTATIASAATPCERVDIELDMDNDSTFVCRLAAATQITQKFRFPDVFDVRAALPSCVDFGSMYSYLQGGKLPEDEKAARRLTYESENFILEDGLLWLLNTPRTRQLDRAYAFIKRCVFSRFFGQKLQWTCTMTTCTWDFNVCTQRQNFIIILKTCTHF